MFERILVCLDGSKLAEQVLPYAREQARGFNSRLILLRVVDDAQVYSAPAEPAVVVEQRERIRKERQEAEEYLASVSESLRSERFDVEATVVGGHSGQTIVRYAEDNDASLIALATHGYGGLGRAVFGSVADYVLRHTSIPVLCIRPRPTD